MEITQKMRDDALNYPTSNADRIKFEYLVSILEELKPSRSIAGKRKSKKTKLDQLFSGKLLESMKGHSPFPLIRLLIPICDRERPAYSIKEKVLANLFCEAVGLDKKSEHAMALLKFNNANHVPAGLGGAVGDFPSVLEGILKNRSCKGNELTIGDVNELLDALSSGAVARKDIIRKIYIKMNQTEIKWFARIVLKDLKIGVKHDKILFHIHPNAPDMYALCSDLRLVLATLRDPNEDFVYSLNLMQAFEPMLASTAYKYDCTNSMRDGFMVEVRNFSLFWTILFTLLIEL
jgi:DNA ligase-4